MDAIERYTDYLLMRIEEEGRQMLDAKVFCHEFLATGENKISIMKSAIPLIVMKYSLLHPTALVTADTIPLPGNRLRVVFSITK